MTIFSDLAGAEAIVRPVDQENFGQHRRAVVQAILESLINAGLIVVSDLEKEVDERTNRFSQLVESEILKAAEVEGASLVLPQLAARYCLYLNSGTPLEHLQSIIAKKGWQHYFRGVYGRPGTKEDHIKGIISQEGCPAQNIVVIGDTQIDWQAAVACGTNFIGINNAYSQWPVNPDFPILRNLTELPVVIAKL